MLLDIASSVPGMSEFSPGYIIVEGLGKIAQYPLEKRLMVACTIYILSPGVARKHTSKP
ncbi:MAG: hypothetical protein H6849_01970 [Alphaproteobacteria bacterium]|nr:MAG: hypothetical protein H6849_01970 [Alphaproteobacteria bacterium]